MEKYLLQETLPLIALPLVQGHQLNQLNQLGINLEMEPLLFTLPRML